MSVPKHVEEAAEAIWKDYHYSGSKATAELSARALDAAGLLRTGLEQRAVEACERFFEYWEPRPGEWSKPGKDIADIGRESLAARKPVPRWTVAPRDESWIVMERASEGVMQRTVLLTEPQARAIAQALNDLEATK